MIDLSRLSLYRFEIRSVMDKVHIRQRVPNCCGMYILGNSISSLHYVGSTNDLNGRRLQHLNCIITGNKATLGLQDLYKLGEDNLYITCFPTETREEAYDLEQAYLDEHYESGNLCNKSPNARLNGASNTNFLGRKHTDETKQKISKTVKNSYSTGHRVNHFLGSKLPESS